MRRAGDLVERVDLAYQKLQAEAVARGLTDYVRWPTPDGAPPPDGEQSDPGAPWRAACPSCGAHRIVVRASVVSRSGFAGRCVRCGYRWEVRRTRDLRRQDDTARRERTRALLRERDG